MQWYWIALIMGAGVTPWVIMSRQLRMAFEEQGLISGLGLWFGIALATTPIVFAIMWLGKRFIAY